MNKNRNKVAAMMMAAAITVSSVAVPVEAAVSNVESVGVQRESKVNQEIKDVVLNEENFPDKAFRDFLAEKFNIANDGTGIITSNKIANTTYIYINSSVKNKINSLEGIEYFINLKDFRCYDQNIYNLDLSKNINLKELTLENSNISNFNIDNLNLVELNCNRNNISSLKLENCAELTKLDARENNIKNIDLSKCKKLTEINLADNLIEKIDLNNNTSLLYLNLAGNKSLSNLNIDNNKLITNLDISYTNIKEINLSENTKLINLSSRDNNIKNYTLTNNTLLEKLELYSNKELIDLDLSKNIKLQNLNLIDCHKLSNLNLNECRDLLSIDINDCRNLKYLDLSNAIKLKNISVYSNCLGYLNINKNAPIEKIETLYPSYIENVTVDSKTNSVDLSKLLPGIDMSRVDVQTEGVTKEDGKLLLGNKKPRQIKYIYNTGGNNNTIKLTVNLELKYDSTGELPEGEGVLLNEANFPDDKFREALSRELDVEEGKLISNEILLNKKYLDISSRNIEKLDGIEYFIALEELDCSKNKINELSLLKNENLKSVNLYDNELSFFKLPDSIESISCGNNLFTELNLTPYKKLKVLYCYNNKKLKSINVTENKLLKILNASGAGIKNINLSKNINLLKLYLTENNIENINLDQNINLEILSMDNNKLNNIKLDKNINLYDISLEDNNLSSIDLTKNKKLATINLYNNKIKNLDLSENTLIKDITDMNSISRTEGKLLVSGFTQRRYILKNIIELNVSNKNYIDLNKEFGITLDEINNNRVKLETKCVKLNGTKIEWEGNTPETITYLYSCGGKRDEVKLRVNLDIVTNPNPQPQPPQPDPEPETPNPDQGGSGQTTPDNNTEKPNKPSTNHAEIIGANRYETAAKIADQMGSYNTVILVNSDKSMADGLSAASLSGKKNAPILLVKKDSIPKETMSRIEKADNVYIIGGEGVISKDVENQLKGKKITRISGKDRYETSQKIANLLGGYKMAFIVNGAKGEADAMSVSAVAAKHGAPILLTNGKTSIHTKKAGVNYYVIGGRAVVSNALADRYDADRISGVDRYSTNRKVMDEFYYDSKKVYFAKGDTLVDALTASTLAKENGIVLVSEKANHSKLEGKDTVQVGGMNFEIEFK